ncbi:hypothetical protein TNCV_5069711 [Trichonephila clavipes]|nr:hypothetical protein TNCV_5069711 [Trichonephila clavipes]
MGVAMHNATVQQLLTTVSPNSNSTIVMMQPEAEFVSKHNADLFCSPWLPFITPLAAQIPVVSSQGQTKQWMPSGHFPLLQMMSNDTTGHQMLITD